MGCDWSMQNAQIGFKKVESLINYVNQYNTANIVLKMSTPSDYVEAVKKENIKWPVRYDDFMPYGEAQDFWTGFYSSRPDSKKYMRDFSSMMSGQNKLLSQMVIKKNISDEEVRSIVSAKDNSLI